MYASFVMQRARERSRELIAEAHHARLARIATSPLGLRQGVAAALRAAGRTLCEIGTAIERAQAV